MTNELNVKQNGCVYTPPFLVNIILDFGGYCGKNILNKHVMDNSCGDGAFLTEIVRRYEKVSVGYSKEKIKRDLETYIHGIEINSEECEKAKRNLDKVAGELNLPRVHWDIRCADTLSCFEDYRSKMDFVFGNPPYVRVHHLANQYDEVKKFSFSQSGMTDLFIVFFEIGFEMLSPAGIMALITPSSWLSSMSGRALREFIRQRHNLLGIIDLEHFQAFPATTYTLISKFSQAGNSRKISYSTLLSDKEKPCFIENISLDDMDIDGGFYISRKKELRKLRKILTNTKKSDIQVKNGFATLRDKVFVNEVDCENSIDVVKGSTGKWEKCVFPYDGEGKPIPFEKLGRKTRKYLLENRELLSPHGDGDWYLFGRSQGLVDVAKNKISINSIIKGIDSIKLIPVGPEKGIYSGLYILTDKPFDIIRGTICSEEFIKYIKALKKYKSGGYYTFSSKDLSKYLNFKLGEQDG